MMTIALRHGPRALVTRPRDEAEGLVAILAERGIGAVVEPLMQVHYRTDAALDLTGVQGVLCTSVNGVRALARASSDRALPLFAVGDTTAARAREEGFTGVESAGGAVADLVRLAAARCSPHRGRLLHVAGSVVAGDLSGDLRARGFVVDRAVLYEAQPVPVLRRPAAQAIRDGMIDFALFFSPRTAAVFARLAAEAGVAGALGTVTALSISAAADAALAGLGWRDRRVAGHPNQPELLAALDQLLAERRRR